MAAKPDLNPLTRLPLSLTASPSHKAHISAATRHPFLQHAGTGTLPANTLCTWLLQDLRYTQAYIRFASGLLSSIVLPGSDSARTSSPPALRVGEKSAETATLQSAIDLLLEALNNVRREQRFFVETVEKYGLDQAWAAAETSSGGRMNEATRAYAGLFDEFAVPIGGPAADGVSVSSGDGGTGPGAKYERLYLGLLVLWSTEWCYYTAWSYAASFVQSSPPSLPNPRGSTTTPQVATKSEAERTDAALRKAFIPNWSSAEFAVFVGRCEDVLGSVGELIMDVDVRARVEERAKGMWMRVLKLEAGFWPDVA